MDNIIAVRLSAGADPGIRVSEQTLSKWLVGRPFFTPRVFFLLPPNLHVVINCLR